MKTVKETIQSIYNEKTRVAAVRLLIEDEVLEHEFLVLEKYLSQTKHIPNEVHDVVNTYHQILGLQPFGKDYKQLYGHPAMFWAMVGSHILGKVIDPFNILRWIGHKQFRAFRLLITAGLEYMEMDKEEQFPEVIVAVPPQVKKAKKTRKPTKKATC